MATKTLTIKQKFKNSIPSKLLIPDLKALLRKTISKPQTEKIFIIYVSNKELVFDIYELLQLNTKNNPIVKEKIKYLNRHFTKEDI